MADPVKMTSYFTKQQKKQVNSNNPIEIIKDFGLGVVRSAASDVIGGIAKNATAQIGLSQNNEFSSSGSLEPNKAFTFPEKPQSPKDEELFFGEKKRFNQSLKENNFSIRDQEVQQKIQAILCELKSLAKSVEAVNKEVAKISVEQVPLNRGVYHLNFFEWLLRTIKLARAKVSESSLWLSSFQSRSSKKGYWQMFKKHGTSFALSNERSVASSLG